MTSLWIDMKMADILTPEVIADAIGRHWRGISGWCPFCGKRNPVNLKVSWR
jgi:hypothetical protein